MKDTSDLLKKIIKCQKVERKHLKNAKHELTLKAIAHNIQKIHKNLNTTLQLNKSTLNKQKFTN